MKKKNIELDFVIDSMKNSNLVEQKEFLLSNEPVARLMGDEFSKIEGKTLKEQINEFFNSVGNKANSVFGDVFLDNRAFKDDSAHGLSRNKIAAFRAVPAILQNGIAVLPISEHKPGFQSGMIAAPIAIAEKEYIAVAVVRKDKSNNNRLYVHEVTLKEKLLTNSSNPTNEANSQGDVANVLQKIISAKPSA